MLTTSTTQALTKEMPVHWRLHAWDTKGATWPCRAGCKRTHGKHMNGVQIHSLAGWAGNANPASEAS